MVLVSQDGVEAGQSGLISMADAANLAASGFTFVELPANVQLADPNGAIVIHTHVPEH